MSLKLSIIEGPDTGRVFEVPMDEPQLIGRSSEALPITDATVSRRHAEMTPDGGVWFIRDLKSQNGTYVNGSEIRDLYRLDEGDEIRVGKTVIRVGDALRSPKLVHVVGEDRIDADVEHRMAANEDSIVLAEPDPGRAAAEHLRVVYELMKITGQIIDRRRLLEAVLDLVFRELEPQRGVVMIIEDEDGAERFRPAVVRYGDEPVPADEAKIEVSRTILRAALEDREGVLSTNAQADPRFAAGDSVRQYNIRSAICSPISFGERTFGAIYIDSSLANYTFTTQQLALLNAIGQHAGLAMANAEATTKRLQAERMAAIGETVASLSHSIKNILQGLRGGADVVEMGLGKGDLPVVGNGWEILRRNLDRIVRLTTNMLAFSRPRSVELTQTNLAHLLEDCQQVLEPLCDRRGIALIIDAEADMVPIPLDADLIHQAMMNLMTNAVEAVPDTTGVVTVRASYHEPGHGPGQRVGLVRPIVEIVVADNGPGIDKTKLAWVFEPFNTTKGIKGTGLGLAVTKRIVTDHGGRIRVESARGKGAVFRLVLPADLEEFGDPSQTRGGTGVRPGMDLQLPELDGELDGGQAGGLESA